MEIKVWKPGTSVEEEANIGYWERNMLALTMAALLNDLRIAKNEKPHCGWYYDTDNNWEGFKRVISLSNGKITYHIPDDFDIGDLLEIKPNWDGHTTEEKYKKMMEICGCKLD